MAPTETEVIEALRAVPYPGFSRDIVSLGVVAGVRCSERRVEVDLTLGSGPAGVGGTIAEQARAAVAALPGAPPVEIRVRSDEPGTPALRMAGAPRSTPAAGGLDPRLIPGVRHAVAVASGKGGVGKSTIAVNLAVALARRGSRVGLLDADVYGPSVPLMTGIDERPALTPDRRLVPFERFGLRIMSLGFLVERDAAVIWRGPMVMKALEQLLRDVDWGELDYLVLDLPPGTGDAQLTLAQRIRLSGAVIVTTPQDVALADARKGVAMFRKVDVPVLGLVENMSYFDCPHCAKRTEIFGHGGGRAEAARLGVPFLGEVPLDPAVREGGDRGRPFAAVAPDSARARALLDIAAAVQAALDVPPSEPAGDATASLFERVRRRLGGTAG
jgi:ATP-binding protein involved in chromosome partitioning